MEIEVTDEMVSEFWRIYRANENSEVNTCTKTALRAFIAASPLYKRVQGLEAELAKLGEWHEKQQALWNDDENSILAENGRLKDELAKRQWQPITSAPMDGLFLVFEDGAMRMMLREHGKWIPTASVCSIDMFGDKQPAPSNVKAYEWACNDPTHWMPLPEPPKEPTP